MQTKQLKTGDGTLGFDDSEGAGDLVLMLPGAGDTRSEYRFLAPRLASRGFRIATMDLRGHGDSSAPWPSYGMQETAADIIAMLEHLGAGPATVIATSFAPTAAIWAAAERPDLIGKLVLISAHLDAAPAWQNALLSLALRGPVAARMWGSQFRSWHPAAPPADLDEQIALLHEMLSDRDRRRAVRRTLVAHRNGLDDRLATSSPPTLAIMGGGDSHFKDPVTEGASIARRTGGTHHMISNAGHYPHVEFPDDAASVIADFIGSTP